ncbi:hypothetical protein HK097_000578 [Rhizophlyctis rosea]|uniref:Uncharacterized protein n=1 Tax=Rhizophlyctis rosea TaxID=64517 RepID=A0AAD5SHR4_9FUNG|nr:hypothetical protein HK097_000578 [Rhizophlyctis rosea]
MSQALGTTLHLDPLGGRNWVASRFRLQTTVVLYERFFGEKPPAEICNDSHPHVEEKPAFGEKRPAGVCDEDHPRVERYPSADAAVPELSAIDVARMAPVLIMSAGLKEFIEHSEAAPEGESKLDKWIHEEVLAFLGGEAIILLLRRQQNVVTNQL